MPREALRRLACLLPVLLCQFIVLSMHSFAVEPHQSPSESADAVSAVDETPISDRDRQHWSFRPLARPALPAVQNAEWCRTPVDYFILSTIEQRGLIPQDDAPAAVLLRRLALDLTGLAPSADDYQMLSAQPAADVYEQQVDRFLGSPRFAPRWAQFWLDLARYADTDGYEFDHPRDDAWRYRDWVVAATNRDLGYDEFLRQQVAGDELYGPDSPQAIATAFCLSGPDMPDINSQEERRHTLLDELTGTVGSVMFGLQIGCAKCHEHKFDPLSQADFFRLRAFFEPAVQVKRNKSISILRDDGQGVQQTLISIRGDWRREGPEVGPGFPRVAQAGVECRIEPTQHGTSGRRVALAQWLTHRDNPLVARVIANRVWQFHFGRGLSDTPSDFGMAGDEPTHPELLDWLACELMEHDWSLKHLHRVIVTSSVYRQASRVASEMHWQQCAAIDARNRWYWHYPRRRLEGEVLRDVMLQAAGLLNEQAGGPGVRPPLSEDLRATLLKNQWNVTPDVAQHYRRSIYLFARRNLRFPIFEAFDRPDANQSCARRFQSTTASQSLLLWNSQFSLDMARHLAGRLLQEVELSGDGADTAANQEQLVQSGFQYVFGRGATAEELSEAQQFLAEQQNVLREQAVPADMLALPAPCPQQLDPCAAAALTDLCLVLLNTNELLYID